MRKQKQKIRYKKNKRGYIKMADKKQINSQMTYTVLLQHTEAKTVPHKVIAKNDVRFKDYINECKFGFISSYK